MPKQRRLRGVQGRNRGGGGGQNLAKIIVDRTIVINDQHAPVFVGRQIIHVSSPASGKAVPV